VKTEKAHEPATRGWPAAGVSRVTVIGALAAMLVVAAAVAIPLELINSKSTTTTSSVAGRHTLTCASSGCAIVNTLHTSPRVTVFYGASCTGVRGAWFLNVAEEGPTGTPHPAYSLRWTFSGNSTVARPSGTVTISPGDDSGVEMTLQQGVLSLRGTNPVGTAVSGVGALTVGLTGSTGTPTLTLTETGLSSAESTLGLLSPFDVNGSPVTVPVKTVSRFAGC